MTVVTTVQDYNHQTRFIAWSILSFMIGIILISLAIGFRQFKLMSSLRIIQRRYPKIVLLESILSIINVLTYAILYNTFFCELDMMKSYQRVLSIITFIFLPVSHGIVYCEVCRLWLICYDINYQHLSKNNAWKLQINKKYGDQNWWMTNKSTLGNYDYVTKRFLILAILSGLLSMTIILIFG